jgi:hypothetical protein
MKDMNIREEEEMDFRQEEKNLRSGGDGYHTYKDEP